jgi:hypothetical protein
VAQFGSADALGALGRRFESCHPDHKTHFMKMQEISELESFTVEEFQSDFDNLMERIESGESFIITSEHGNVVMVPYKEVVQVFEELWCE